jgi:hypothetical protein
MVGELRDWFWVDTVMVGLRTYWFILVFFGLTGPFAGPEFHDTYWLMALWIIAGYCGPLYFWRPGFMKPARFVLLEFLLNGGLCLFYAAAVHRTTLLLLIPTMIVGFVSGRKIWWWSAPLFLFIFLIGILFVQLPLVEVINQTIYATIMYGAGLTLNMLIYTHNRTRQLMKLVEEKNAALTQYAKQVEQLTLLEERNRLARELHDSLGHKFTSVIVGLDVAIHLVRLDAAATEERLIHIVFSTSASVRLCNVSNNVRQPSSHICSKSAAVVFADSNSVSRFRSGFSPSAVKKSVHLETMFPLICLIMVAMLLDSLAGDQFNCSSVNRVIVLSPRLFVL